MIAIFVVRRQRRKSAAVVSGVTEPIADDETYRYNANLNDNQNAYGKVPVRPQYGAGDFIASEAPGYSSIPRNSDVNDNKFQTASSLDAYQPLPPSNAMAPVVYDFGEVPGRQQYQ